MNNRLYVGNLAFGTDRETLQDAFSRCGTVDEVKIITDRETGQSRGFAFVSMADGAAAQKALAELNGQLVDGRALRVSEAEERQRGAPSGSRRNAF